MRSVLVGGCLVCSIQVCSLPGCVAQPVLQEPLPVRNQHPAQLLVMHMPPASTRPTAAGEWTARLDAAYSSLFLQGNANGSSWIMDGEYLRTAATVRAGLAPAVELALEVPFAHTSGGFLDSFIIGYHELFGFPDQNRDAAPKDRYRVSARRAGEEVFGVEQADFELMDVPVYATWQLAAPAERCLGLALRGGVELPTGDGDRGYGNSELDCSLGALAEYPGHGIGLYGHVQHTFAGTPDQSQRAGLAFADVTSLGLAAELPLTPALHGFVQIEWENSALRHLELDLVRRDHVMLCLGGRLQLSAGWAVEVGFAEDLVGRSSPDFTAWLGVQWAPGAAAPAGS